MNFLDKLQSLPAKKRKLILWIIIAILAVFLFLIYIQNLQKRIKYNNGGGLKEELQIDKLEERLKDLPEL